MSRAMRFGIAFAFLFVVQSLAWGDTPAAKPLPEGLTDVTIKSSKDGTPQHALWYKPAPAPGESPPVPLLVLLHSWSGNYLQRGNVEICLAESKERGWALIAPDFRGPNLRPEACASPLAVQDVLDAIDYAKANAEIDANRVYLVGSSGGGHMSLIMAAQAPELFAGVSAWVPITDLASWYGQTLKAKLKYARDLVKVCGGVPGSSAEVNKQYHERSSLHTLPNAKGLAVDINAGIHDGHTGSVPISHSLHAFNVLAAANGQGQQQVRPDEIDYMVATQKVPQSLAKETVDEPGRAEPVLFRRTAGPARLTIFAGGHSGDMKTAIRWLAEQKRASQP